MIASHQRWARVASYTGVAVTLTFVGGLSSVAAGQRHQASLDVSIGGDSNPALAANPRDRARMDPTVLRPAATLAVDLASRLALLREQSVDVSLSPYFTARGFSSGGAYTDLGSAFLLGWDRGRHRLEVRAMLGGYAATFALDNAMYGDASLGSVLSLGPLALRVDGYTRFRSYTANQLDGIFGAQLGVLGETDHVAFALRVAADRRLSSAPEARRAELGTTIEASGVEGPWRWLAATSVYSRWFANAPRDGREWMMRARLDRTLTRRLALFLAVQVGRARGVRDGAEALAYGRAALELGVVVQLTPDRRPSENEGVTRIAANRYRFVFHAPGATTVALLASFLDWDAEAGTLTPTGDGWFEGTFDVPDGRHRYRVVVDDAPQTPPASAYADDGFGGRDAVLIAN